MNKKSSHFVVNPQKHEIQFVNEGNKIKNPKKFIAESQKFYKSKGIDIPIKVFENAYKKANITESKTLYFKVNPNKKQIEFVNENNTIVKDKKKLINESYNFFKKKGQHIPKKVLSEAFDRNQQYVMNTHNNTQPNKDELIQKLQSLNLNLSPEQLNKIANDIIVPSVEPKAVIENAPMNEEDDKGVNVNDGDTAIVDGQTGTTTVIPKENKQNAQQEIATAENDKSKTVIATESYINESAVSVGQMATNLKNGLEAFKTYASSHFLQKDSGDGRSKKIAEKFIKEIDDVIKMLATMVIEIDPMLAFAQPQTQLTPTPVQNDAYMGESLDLSKLATINEGMFDRFKKNKGELSDEEIKNIVIDKKLKNLNQFKQEFGNKAIEYYKRMKDLIGNVTVDKAYDKNQNKFM